MGVGPLHEHSPAVLPGGLDTESPLPKHRRPPQGTSSSTPIARAQRGADAGAGSQHHSEGGLGPPVPEGSSGPAVCTDSLPKGGWGRASARPADGTPGCAGPPGGRVCRAADLRASGRAPRGGCWYCLTMSLICCVGCGKRSELSVEDRAGSGQREAVAGGRAGARVRPHSQSWPGKPPLGWGTHWFLEKPSPALERGQPRAWSGASGPWPEGQGPRALERSAGARAWLGVRCLRTSAEPLALGVSVESRGVRRASQDPSGCSQGHCVVRRGSERHRGALGAGSPLGAGAWGRDSGAAAGAPWPAGSSRGPGERWWQ